VVVAVATLSLRVSRRRRMRSTTATSDSPKMTTSGSRGSLSRSPTSRARCERRVATSMLALAVALRHYHTHIATLTSPHSLSLRHPVTATASQRHSLSPLARALPSRALDTVSDSADEPTCQSRSVVDRDAGPCGVCARGGLRRRWRRRVGAWSVCCGTPQGSCFRHH
jgi:hypothetical protein